MFPIIDSVQYVQLDVSYSVETVAFSILIVCVAAFVAIHLNARIDQYSFIQNYIWAALASTTMSLGIWSMHFIGMTAIHIHHEMEVNYALIFLSIFPTVIVSYIAFYLVNKERAGMRTYIVASLMMGTAIASMHYLGMFTMSFSHIIYTYNTYMVIVSLVLAVAVSYIALGAMNRYKHLIHLLSVQIIVAVLLGMAVSSVHYLGLFSMTFYQELPLIHELKWVSPDVSSMNIAVSFGILLLILIFLSASMVDRYASHRLKHLDALTQLPNRHAFMKLIHDGEEAHSVAIISFENLEFSTGEYDFLIDEVIVEKVADVLKEHLPSMTTLYRVKERHFIYVAKDERATKELMQILEMKMRKLARGFQIDGEGIKVPAVCLVHRGDGKGLVRDLHANAVLVEQHPGTTYNYTIIHYNANYHTRDFTDQLLNDLHMSLERKELYLVYQPKVYPYEGAIESVEALIRWQHPEYGFLSPGVFIPMLEAHNRINELTDWVIEEVCLQLQKWRGQSGLPSKVSINIPGPYLTSNRLKTQLMNMTELYKIDPSQIELEVTETSFVKSIEEARRAVDDLRTNNFKVALDDFGIGVSSLAYVKDFRFTTLKIDKSFMDFVPHSAKDCSVMQSILSLGKSLNMQVVAEGIETKEQVNFLLGASRDIVIQGYYYAKPMTAADLAVWCNEEKPQLKAQSIIEM